VLLTVTALLLTAVPVAAAGPPVDREGYEPAVAAMLAEINETELRNTTYDLQEIPTRAYGTAGNREAGEYLYRRLNEIPGLTVEFQGGDLRNVVATLPGSGRTAGEIVVVGAHYDSTSSDPDRAPGATDNGCGVAIVLELARVMSQHSFNRTVQFGFWNAEEDGGYGSAGYAEEARNRSVPVVLYFNYDSACHDPESRSILDIVHDERSWEIAVLMAERNIRYGINLILTENRHTCASDHISFRDRGFPTVATHCEEHGPAHTPDDTIEHVSFEYAAKNARLGLSALSEAAGLRDGMVEYSVSEGPAAG
jgi:Zn-dependent M28 family amino/carboxypeptidase